MSLHLLDLRPIKDFAPTDKVNLPVSIALLPDGTPLVVSRYGDVIWDFYPYIPQENLHSAAKMIDWRFKLPDGRLLTDSAHKRLLDATKEFIWSLFADPVEGRKRPSMLSLLVKASHTKHLLRFMVKSGISSYAALNGRTLEYVPLARIDNNGKPNSAGVVVLRLLLVEDIFNQRHKLHDAISDHPWPHETATSLSGLRTSESYFRPTTEIIKDDVLTSLAKHALDYVRNRSERILTAKDITDAAGNAAAEAGLSKQCRSRKRTAAARNLGWAGNHGLKTESARLRTACYILIDMFCGIRDSEMMSLAEDCITPGKSKDGSTDILWLHGTIYKTSLRPKRWLVPTVVAEAIQVLTRLTAPLRTELIREEAELQPRIANAISKEQARLMKRLITVRRNKDKLFLTAGRPGYGISVLSGSAMGQELKRFCADFGIRGDDGQPYPLHAHQFRRTYARLIARSELGDLLTLRDHFGHWSIDMTVNYADGGADEYEADTELLEMVTQEKMERQDEIMRGYLASDAPLANGGHWLKGWRASVRTAANKEALIKEFAGTITLNGTGHSWCVGNARGTGCGGLCVFEAQMCVECNYGIIGQEHRPVWEGIREQQKEALALDDMGPGGRARSQNILNCAEKVLRRLDGHEAA